VDVKNLSLESILSKYQFSEENRVKIRMMREKEQRISQRRRLLRSMVQDRDNFYPREDFDEV